MRTGFTGRVQRRAVIALVCLPAAALAVLVTTGIAQSQSRAVILMRTSVTAIRRDGHAKVIAIVHPGAVGGAPHGKVTFINRTTHRTLGSAPLRSGSGGACAVNARTCQAVITVSGTKLVLNANRIVGIFNPQKLYSPSFEGHTWLYRGVSPRCRVRATSLPVFTAGMPTAHPAATRTSSLCRGRVRTSGADVLVISRSRVVVARESVMAFGNQRLPCSGRGKLLAYSISGNRAPGALEFRVFGRSATREHANHPNGYACYESTIPFRTASGARAKQLANGYFYGPLPHCRDNDGDDIYPVRQNGDDPQIHPAPCIEWQQYSVHHGVGVLAEWIEPTTGDPRLHY